MTLAVLSFVPILTVLAYIGAPTRRLRRVVIWLFLVGLVGVVVYSRNRGWECEPDCGATTEAGYYAAYYTGLILFFLDWYVIIRLFREVATSVRENNP